jgi:hypothetical protein
MPVWNKCPLLLIILVSKTGATGNLMEIKINNNTLDVSLENEKTIGDVLTGLEQWLTDTGHRISEIRIDGQPVTASMINDIFSREINSVKSIDINTNVIAELIAASLINLSEDIKEYENLSFEEKKIYFDRWKESATAAFISIELPDLYTYCINTFSVGEITTLTLQSITEEIQREVNEPVNELTNLEPILKNICERLENLPLDVQTGKDGHAAQTIQIFSAVAEKIFRIYRQLDIQGYFSGINKNGKPLAQLITEFGNVLKDLLEAYEKNDSVLVGDITEYEASPKLKELYSSILENCQNTIKQDKK